MENSNSLKREFIFEPKYSFRIKLGFAISAIFDLVALYILITDPAAVSYPWFWGILGMFFIVPALVLYFTIIKKVRISEDIIVYYSIRKPFKFQLSEITDIGITAIETEKGRVSLYGVKNSEELLQQIFIRAKHKSEKGQIKGNFIKGDLIKKDLAASRALMPSLILSAVIYFSLLIFKFVDLSDDFIPLLVFIVVYLCFYLLQLTLLRKNSDR